MESLDTIFTSVADGTVSCSCLEAKFDDPASACSVFALFAALRWVITEDADGSSYL